MKVVAGTWLDTSTGKLPKCSKEVLSGVGTIDPAEASAQAAKAGGTTPVSTTFLKAAVRTTTMRPFYGSRGVIAHCVQRKQ
jgi:hypothetical protein